MAKKLLSLIRAILFILKRSSKLAGKTIGNLLLEHQTLTCRPNNVHKTFIAPVEYEFSCRDTPLFYHKRKTNRHLYPSGTGFPYRRSYKDHELAVSSVKKVFHVFDTYNAMLEPEKSPLTVLGFGQSGTGNVRQLRVTDSPFPENDTEEEDGGRVDRAAEEFIEKFYRGLKLEKRSAAGEVWSPACYRKWGELR